MGLIKTATDIASGATGIVAKASGILGWLPWAIAAVGVLVGTGGTVWYRMQWKDCEAASAQAIIEQRDIDRADNAKAVGRLTNKLNDNEAKYEYDMQVLSNIPKRSSCERDKRIDAVREQLCARYPASEACNRPRPTR